MLQLHCMTLGTEALKWVADGKVLPDLILLDCMMPGMSGSTPLPMPSLMLCHCDSIKGPGVGGSWGPRIASLNHVICDCMYANGQV